MCPLRSEYGLFGKAEVVPLHRPANALTGALDTGSSCVMGPMLLSKYVIRVHSRALVRAGVAGLIGTAAIALTGLAGAGGASADPLTCTATNGQNVIRTDGYGACGAKAGPGSLAHAEDHSRNGTAVASSNTGGNANAYNLQPNTSALSGAVTGGTGFSITTGPGGMAVSQARAGGTSIAVAGWGGSAYSGPYGTACSGSFAAAVDTSTGQACIGSGGIWLSTPRPAS